MVSQINSYFDKIFVLSLKTDVHKRKRIKQDLSQYGIEFEFFDGVYGNSIEFDYEWSFYNQRSIKTNLEKLYNKKFIESRGALGCLKSYLEIFRYSIKMNFNRILVLEDDIVMCHDFENKFIQFQSKIDSDWKIILLGASQYKWDETIIKDHFYHPKILTTFGTFAAGYDKSIFNEIIVEGTKFHTSIDNLPLGLIYEKYKNKCFVSYPNIIIADVRDSIIRESRDLTSHALKMRWPLENFTF